MARKTAEEAERTRQRILASGAQVFASCGFSCATLEIIAKRAGLSRGAVYWHFKGKEELLLAVMQDITLPVERFFSAGMNLHRNIQRLYTAIEQTLIKAESRQLCEILLKRSEGVAGATPIIERLYKVRGNLTSQMQRMLENAISEGEVDSSLNISLTCRLFQMWLSGLFFECVHGALDVPRHIKMTLDVISDILFKPPTHLLSVSDGQSGTLLP